jgi:hypothetical protein
VRLCAALALTHLPGGSALRPQSGAGEES